MSKLQSYKGILRSENPDWLGWFILDLLQDNPDAPEEHNSEIKLQLDYEVRDFNFNKKVA